MTTDLIPRERIVGTESGTYYIPVTQLITAYREDYEAAERGMLAIIAAYPEFQFSTGDDVSGRGIWIYWKRKEKAVEA